MAHAAGVGQGTAPPEVPQEQTYTPEEARALLQMGRKTIYALLRSGQLRSYQAGANYRIPASAITEYRGDKPTTAPTVTTVIRDAVDAAQARQAWMADFYEQQAHALRAMAEGYEFAAHVIRGEARWPSERSEGEAA